MGWTRASGGILGALLGAALGGGVAYVITKDGEHTMPATVGAAIATGIAGGLGGAKLGKTAQFNAWNNANAACPGNNVADWATLQCTAGCPDDSIPVNGKCPGVVPTSNLLGA